MLSLTITNSSRCTFLNCPFSYYCEYMLRLSPCLEPVYFQWGSLVHAWAAELEAGTPTDEILAAVYEEIESRSSYLSLTQIAEMEEMIAIIPIVFKVHTAKWGEIDKYFESLNIEHKFSLPLTNGWTFEGKIDNVRRDARDGKKWNWERKTAAKTGPTYWSRLPRDSQAKGYVIASRECWGINVEGAIYDIFKKPSLTRNQGEAIDHYYGRIATAYLNKSRDYMERGPLGGKDIKPLIYKSEVLEEYYQDLLGVCEQIEFSMTRGIWTKHCPGNKIGGCSFTRLCEDGINEETLQGYRQRESNHPELTKI